LAQNSKKKSLLLYGKICNKFEYSRQTSFSKCSAKRISEQNEHEKDIKKKLGEKQTQEFKNKAIQSYLV
jgi:hypothetical protein